MASFRHRLREWPYLGAGIGGGGGGGVTPEFTAGFDLAYEARDGALEPGATQATDGEAVQSWINKGALGATGDLAANSENNRAVYEAAKIAGQDAAVGDGAVFMFDNGVSWSMDKLNFSMLMAVRFDARVSGTGIFAARHHSANGASYIQYDWAANELFFRNFQKTPFVANNLTLTGVPEDTDLCLGIILAAGTIKCFWYNTDAELQELQSTGHIEDLRINDIFNLMNGNPEFAVSKMMWWNEVDISDDLAANVAAMFVEGFPVA